MRPHLCQVSLMNPAVHSRIFFKEALTLVAAGWQVTIIGRDAATAPYEREGVTIVPIPDFARLSLARMRMRHRVAGLAAGTQADVFVVHSPELAPAVARLRSERPRARIVYDVHEDYFRNIRYGGYYPPLLRNRLAAAVRQRELTMARTCDGLLLAEDCFEEIFENIGTPRIFLRNKFQRPASLQGLQASTPAEPTLLVTGTLAEAWGLFHAVDLWVQINRHLPVNLVVAGHSHSKELIQKLRGKIKSSGFESRFSLIGGNDYVPYEEIVKQIAACTAGLALYNPQENIKDRVPTKFYEFMAFGKPLFYTDNEPWNRLNDQWHFGIAVKEQALREQAFHLAMVLAGRESLPPPQYGPADYLWEEESRSLVPFLTSLLPGS